MKRFKTTTACFDTINQCFDFVEKIRKDFFVINKVEITFSDLVELYFLEVWYE